MAMAGRTGPRVTVMGGGIFGLAVAHACASRGAQVRLIEARRIGAGASGGLVGALAPHVPEAWNPKKAFQLDSLLMAERWWAGVAALSGRDPGYRRTGRVQPLADAAAVDRALQRQAQAADLWQGRAVWRVLPLAEAPGLALSSASGRVVYDTLGARLHPRRACAALAAALWAQGGRIVEGVSAPPPDADGPVVWATGWEGLGDAWAGPAPGAGVKGQAALLELAAPDAPQLFADGLHIVPHDDGTVAVGSTSERDWSDPTATDVQLDAVIARARAACPALAGARVLERWAGVRPRAASRAPVLGAWPGRAGHFIANGGFKIGFGIAPLAGEAMADLVLDDHDRIPQGFRPVVA